MSVEQCYLSVCFIPLDSSGEKFFGFSEFLAGLALMVLAWTIADVRYRFRVRTAPIPLLGITFSVVATVGVLTLFTDLWRAEKWLVPAGNLLTPASWQAILGGLFLLTFLTWTWFAFIRPPTYGRLNAKRFAQTLYRFVLKGSPEELAIIADELTYSALPLVHHATDRKKLGRGRTNQDGQKKELPKVERYANDLLLLIADKRLCRSIVSSSPGTALAFFQAMADTKKYGIQIETFAKNIVNEALANKDSFIYHEAEGYESGLIGYHKPLSHAMFANYGMVERIGTLLDPDVYDQREWDASHWEAYCRVVLITFEGYVEEKFSVHSPVLFGAKFRIENSVSDLYKLNGLTGSWDTDPARRLRAVVEFLKDSIKVLEEKGVPDYVRIRVKQEFGHPHESYFDGLASLFFEVVFHASAVKSPKWECWSIQHNSLWSELFNSGSPKGPAAKVVKFKIRRLLYDEILEMKSFPNFKGAKILSFCLNVMGLKVGEGSYYRDSRALHVAVLSWTKQNFAWLYQYNPRVAEACLVDGMSFEQENNRLVYTSPAEGLRRKPSYVYLYLDHAPPEEALEAALNSV